MFCEKCGCKNEESASVCKECGNALNIIENFEEGLNKVELEDFNQASNPDSLEKEEPENLSILKIVVFIIAIISLIVIGIIAYKLF